MKRNLVAFLVLLALPSALALPNFDPFADATAGGGTSYTVDMPLAGNNQFVTNDWQPVGSNFTATNPQPMIVAGNLTYPDLTVTSTGNCVSNAPPLSGTGGSARLNLRLGTAPPLLFYSFILKVTDVSAVPTANANNFIAGFSDATAAQATGLVRCGGRLVSIQTGGGFQLGIGKGSISAEYAYDPTIRNVGDVLFVVVSYERAGGATNVNLWVNPPASSFGSNAAPPSVASVTSGGWTGDMNASGAASFVLSCQTAFSPSCLIDEIRVATNWGTVTAGNPTIPIAITADPDSRNVKENDRVAFVVGASGTDPAYQWRFNDTDILDATNAAYAIEAAQTTNAGNYSVVITNSSNALTSAPAALAVSATAFPLYETNLLVVRVGDGAQPLSAAGNSVFLDQFTTAGGYLNTTFISDTGASAFINPGPDLNGSVITGTALTRSANGQKLVLSGYNVGLTNTTPLQNTTGDVVPRSIATINGNGQIALEVVDIIAYSAGYFRGAASDGTNNYWGAGNIGGTYYFGLEASAGFVQTTFANTRSVDIFNGNLYCLASASGANGLVQFTGLPVTDQSPVANILTGLNSVNTTDFSVNGDGTLVYLTVGSTIQRWSFSASTWANDYNLTLPATGRYLTVDYSGAAPVIYVDTGDGSLYRIEDTGAGSTPTLLASAGPNQLYKGVRFGPLPAPATRPTLAHSLFGGELVLSWSGPYTLMSATNVAGPYTDVVPPATSPYTNSTGAELQQFFGLRQN